MTLKQRRFKLAIKHGAKSIAEAKRAAGYVSEYVYERQSKTKQLIDEALPKEDKIVNDFEYAKQLALEDKDLTNFNRSNESLARIRGMYKDKSEITTSTKVNPNDLEPHKVRKTLEDALKSLPVNE